MEPHHPSKFLKSSKRCPDWVLEDPGGNGVLSPYLIPYCGKFKSTRNADLTTEVGQ